MSEAILWSPGVTLEQIERQVILKAYRFYRENKTATAAALGIAVRTLDNKFAKYEQDQKDQHERDEAEQRRRAELLRRARGIHPAIPTNPTAPGAADRPQATAGADVEPALVVAAQPSVPLPERPEIQSMLPPPAAGDRPRKARL